MNGRPALPPSPPHSVTRSSTTTSMYSVGGNNAAGGAGGAAAAGRKYSTHLLEDQLQEHHRVLKDFLAQSLREDRQYKPHNRARDKLLRLSQIQFQELSTDVYDELLRREDERNMLQDPSQSQTRVPKFLLPKNNFHPKRNQARQKLSTLASKKFRELATDVLFELERRYPKFTGAENVRGSTVSSKAGGMTVGIPSYGSQGRRPSATSPPYSPGVFDDGTPMPGSGDFGRPLAKQFYADTMVPNKSTMVEDDDDQSADDEDAFGLEGRTTTRSSRRATNMSSAVRMGDSNAIAENQAQLSRLEQKVTELEDQLREKDNEMQRKDENLRQRDEELQRKDDDIQQKNEDLQQALSETRESQQALESERAKLTDMNSDLESRVSTAERLNLQLKNDVEELKLKNAQLEQDLVNTLSSSESNEWKSRYEDLEAQFQERQQMANEVRQEAAQSLQEMRELTERTNQAMDHEESLMQQVSQLEIAVKEWKSRYAKAKAQARTARVNSMGRKIDNPDVAQYASQQGYADVNGLIRDVSVSEFQIAVDELLHATRSEEGTAMIDDYLRSVVLSVQTVAKDLESGPAKDPPEVIKKQNKLKSRINTACNDLISTSRNFAKSNGLAPVSVVDSATTNLSFAVVELIKIAKIRPSPPGELDHDDDAHALA